MDVRLRRLRGLVTLKRITAEEVSCAPVLLLIRVSPAKEIMKDTAIMDSRFAAQATTVLIIVNHDVNFVLLVIHAQRIAIVRTLLPQAVNTG